MSLSNLKTHNSNTATNPQHGRPSPEVADQGCRCCDHQGTGGGI